MAAAEIPGLTAGFKFEPEDEEVIELYLVPRLRGRPLPLDDIIVDGDDPRSAPPWELFSRNGLETASSAYFFAPGDAAGSRKVRTVAGVGTWEGQKIKKTGKLRVGEEIFAWQKYRLSFHFGTGKTKSLSTGWVMLEYSVVAAPTTSLFSRSATSPSAATAGCGSVCLTATLSAAPSAKSRRHHRRPRAI